MEALPEGRREGGLHAQTLHTSATTMYRRITDKFDVWCVVSTALSLNTEQESETFPLKN